MMCDKKQLARKHIANGQWMVTGAIEIKSCLAGKFAAQIRSGKIWQT